MFYGSVSWDPWLIVAQIVCLQCLYYLTLGVFLALLVGTRVSKMSLFYFFDYAIVTASTVTGWCVMASIFLSSVAGAGYLVFLIERAKKCLDFSATLYILHLFICIMYGGWPSSMTWWVVNITAFAVMALLGEYLCMRRELREIPISRYRSRMCENLRFIVSYGGEFVNVNDEWKWRGNKTTSIVVPSNITVEGLIELLKVKLPTSSPHTEILLQFKVPNMNIPPAEIREDEDLKWYLTIHRETTLCVTETTSSYSGRSCGHYSSRI